MLVSPKKLPLTISTLYAELLDLSEDDLLFGYQKGTFVRKTVKGKTYWYRQIRIGGNQVQVYLGPQTKKLLNQIEETKLAQGFRREELRRRRGICRALRAAISYKMDQTTVRIIKSLSDAGAFSAGAVLIGTNAYSIYAAMLGRKFKDIHAQTSDVDIAAVQLAVGDPVSFSDAIRNAEENMLIVPPAPRSRISTKLKLRGLDYKVELLTPGSQEGEKAVVIENLRFGAQPLQYLDFLIKSPIDAVLPADAGVRIKVPLPERYALHKLIVAQVRDRSAFAKRQKDLAQAQELLAALREDLPRQLAEAWAEIKALGSGYLKYSRLSLRELGIRESELEEPQQASS